jgi:hypothetical protein
MQVNVPVSLPLVSWRTPSSDWLTEPKEVRPGLNAARTLLPESDQYAAVLPSGLLTYQASSKQLMRVFF